MAVTALPEAAAPATTVPDAVPAVPAASATLSGFSKRRGAGTRGGGSHGVRDQRMPALRSSLADRSHRISCWRARSAAAASKRAVLAAAAFLASSIARSAREAVSQPGRSLGGEGLGAASCFFSSSASRRRDFLSGKSAPGLRFVGASSHCSSSITSIWLELTSAPSSWIRRKACSATRRSSRCHSDDSCRNTLRMLYTNSRRLSCLSPDLSHARIKSLGEILPRISICFINMRKDSTDSKADGSTSQHISSSVNGALGGAVMRSSCTTALRARESSAWR